MRNKHVVYTPCVTPVLSLSNNVVSIAYRLTTKERKGNTLSQLSLELLNHLPKMQPFLIKYFCGTDHLPRKQTDDCFEVNKK